MELTTGSNLYDNGRVVKLFCTVGLNEHKITKYVEDEVAVKYVQKMDIIKKNMRVNLDKLEYENEKW
jgi:hypothetical protein